MADFQIRSDNVDVEQIMRQIRSRIREKRGVDYTEEEIRELARVKLEKFLDPRGVRSDLLEQFRKLRSEQQPVPNFAFEDTTIFETHRGLLRWIRKVLRPILKLFFNPAPISQALHIQSDINRHNARRAALDSLHYELIHNLVLETTRLGIEVKNLKMRVESMSSRLDFDERRARALEGVVQYRAGAVPPLQPPPASGGAAAGSTRETEQQAQERRTRRRRRRGRRPASAREGSETGYGAAGPASAREGSETGYGAAGPASARDGSEPGYGAAGSASASTPEGSEPGSDAARDPGEAAVARNPQSDGGGEG